MNTMVYKGHTAEDYLEMCEELGMSPQKPYSGNLTLHIPPEVHIGIARAAEASGKNLDQWATDTFTNALQSEASL